MSRKKDLQIPITANDFIQITSLNKDQDTPSTTVARVRSINRYNGRTTATLEFPSNDRHSSPPDMIIPVRRIKDTGCADLPFKLGSSTSTDFFRRIPSYEVSDKTKRRFS